jgi:hypothetical protein
MITTIVTVTVLAAAAAGMVAGCVAWLKAFDMPRDEQVEMGLDFGRCDFDPDVPITSILEEAEQETQFSQGYRAGLVHAMRMIEDELAAADDAEEAGSCI